MNCHPSLKKDKISDGVVVFVFWTVRILPPFPGLYANPSNDGFRVELNSCGICRKRHASASFPQFGGTAVSRPGPEFAAREQDANERQMG
jgi:hypothetical protein